MDVRCRIWLRCWKQPLTGLLVIVSSALRKQVLHCTITCLKNSFSSLHFSRRSAHWLNGEKVTLELSDSRTTCFLFRGFDANHEFNQVVTAWGQKTQTSIRDCEIRSFKRLPAMHLIRTDVPSTSPMFPRAFSPERRPALIACPHSFTFQFKPMIVSDLSNHQDADEIHSATVAFDADHSC